MNKYKTFLRTVMNEISSSRSHCTDAYDGSAEVEDIFVVHRAEEGNLKGSMLGSMYLALSYHTLKTRTSLNRLIALIVRSQANTDQIQTS